MNSKDFLNDIKRKMNHSHYQLAKEADKQYVENMNDSSLNVILFILATTTCALYSSFYFSSLISNSVRDNDIIFGSSLYMIVSMIIFIYLRIPYSEKYQDDFPAQSKIECQSSIDDSVFLHLLFFFCITVINCVNILFIQFYETDTLVLVATHDVLVSNEYYFYNTFPFFFEVGVAMFFYNKQVVINDEIKRMFRLVNYSNSFHKKQ